MAGAAASEARVKALLEDQGGAYFSDAAIAQLIERLAAKNIPPLSPQTRDLAPVMNKVIVLQAGVKQQLPAARVQYLVMQATSVPATIKVGGQDQQLFSAFFADNDLWEFMVPYGRLLNTSTVWLIGTGGGTVEVIGFA